MNWIYHIHQQMIRGTFSAFFNIRVFNRENVPLQGPVLLVSNHQSFLDPLLCGLGLNRECDYLARDSLFANPWFGAYIRALNAFPVQRDQADTKAIKDIINRLKANHAVVMFPEATRSHDGKIRPFKNGFAMIARRAGATIVPAVIDGAFDAWSRHRLLPVPANVRVMFGPAVSPQQAATMTRDQLVQKINHQLRQMQTELRQRYHKPPYKYD